MTWSILRCRTSSVTLKCFVKKGLEGSDCGLELMDPSSQWWPHAASFTSDLPEPNLFLLRFFSTFIIRSFPAQCILVKLTITSSINNNDYVFQFVFWHHPKQKQSRQSGWHCIAYVTITSLYIGWALSFEGNGTEWLPPPAFAWPV